MTGCGVWYACWGIASVPRDEAPAQAARPRAAMSFSEKENNTDGAWVLLISTRNDVFGKVYNIACGESVSVNDLYKMIADELGKTIHPNYEKARPGEIKNSLADISSAIENFNYKPQLSVGEGVKKTVAWYASKSKISS